MSTEDFKDFEHWLSISEKRSPKTIKQYINHIGKLKDMLSEKGIDIMEAKAVNNYLNSTLAHASFKLMVSAVLRKYYKFKGNKELVLFIDRPSYKQHEAKLFIDQKTLDIMVDSCVLDRDKLILLLLFDTACRRDEFLNITTESIDMDKREISIIGKGNKQRYVKFTEHTKQLLLPWMRYKGKLFDEQNESILRNTLKRIAKKSGIPDLPNWISPHKFRHGWATEARRRGMPLDSIRRYLGHESIVTTDKFYSHIPTEETARQYDEVFNK